MRYDSETDTNAESEDDGDGDGVPAGPSGTVAVPVAALPLHLASEEERAALQERVNRTYGAFGERSKPQDSDESATLLSDNGWKHTASIIGVVFVTSLFLSFVSRPAFDGPGAWANSFRLDTVFVVVWAPIVFWMMAKLPLWKSLRTYLVLALFIEAFSEVMFKEKGDGYWNSVMWPAAVGFFGTIKELSGVPGASLPIFFFVTAVLLYRAVYEKKAATYKPPPRFAVQALLVFLVAVIALAVIGMARGGQIEWTFRQVVHLIQLPLVALVFLYALRVPEDLAAVGTAFVVAAVVRSLLVVYVYFGVCVPAGITELPGKPEWCTNHSDTVLFVSAMVILFVHALEQRRSKKGRKMILQSLGLGAVIFLAIILNNRRLALVSLGIAPIVIYLALDPSKTKRRVTLALAVTAPLLVGYVIVGSETSSASPVFKPAKALMSITDQNDASAVSRDIENENLIYTLQKQPLVRGFGHEYESSPNNPPVDLGTLFKNYRLIAHNGVLWLWSIAGVLGFALLWFIYPLAGTLAMRGYRVCGETRGNGTALERAAALGALGCIAVCIVQIWGDQGMNSYMTLVTFGVSFAVASRLAVRDT
jgi:hypothetical protein